jgi:hypothetical protein
MQGADTTKTTARRADGELVSDASNYAECIDAFNLVAPLNMSISLIDSAYF